MRPAWVCQLVLATALGLPVAAQTSHPLDTGTIAGVVVDPQGAPIPGVKVTAGNDETGGQYEVTTNCSGHYRISDLPLGSYRVQFAARRFRPETKASVYVCPSRVVELDSKLQVSTAEDPAERFGVYDLEPENAPAPTNSPTQLISGTVIDPQGAVVSGVHVSATQAPGNHYATRTAEDGSYRLSNLQAGSYCLNFEAAPFIPQTVIVQAGQMRDVRLGVGPVREKVEVCSETCLIETRPAYVPPRHPGIALEVRTPSNIIAVGSPLLVTVVLRNLTDHPISIALTGNSDSTFTYDIYATGACGCPGKMRRGDRVLNPHNGEQAGESKKHTVSVLPGRSLADTLDLAKLANLQWTEYGIMVERHDTSHAANGEETLDQPTVRSNAIRVRLVPASIAEACKLK